ncbi:MAG TPA: rhodanese-like domain-containing protein [Candidatus Polarisedimenticolia bacterium]|nr:rhodanese-like domain-containing protein [Candidatus Polarisedimenticolia bacterium]
MSGSTGVVQNIPPVEAERLAARGDVRLLDVRTPEEYRDLGHIPGATLLPIDLIAAAPATLPVDDRPLLVYCEHGVRSAAAARFLARAGFPQVLNMTGGMSCWTGPRDHAPGDPFGPAGPSSWLVANADLLTPGGRALDLACGRGRHALLLAAAGMSVRAVDRDQAAVAYLADVAARLRLDVRAEVLDLETEPPPELGREAYDLVLGVHYLHRPLFPALVAALRSGGVLLYETFTVDQAPLGHPRNPAFLLQHGELARLAAPLRVLRERDGLFEGRHVASVAARATS